MNTEVISFIKAVITIGLTTNFTHGFNLIVAKDRGTKKSAVISAIILIICFLAPYLVNKYMYLLGYWWWFGLSIVFYKTYGDIEWE